MSQDRPRGDAVSPTVTHAPTEGVQGELLAPGQVLGGRYEIRSLLGRGGMGQVWRAFDLKLRMDIALKSLHGGGDGSDRRLELVRREVRAARAVVSPNVCRIFDLVEVDGRELVSMEFVDGETLLDVLREHAPLDLKHAQDIASQFLAGLEAIHAAGLVHRDVKPENIMLTRAGRVVVMDFGLARKAADPEVSCSGTPAYMSPELAEGREVDARADVYAAGVVLAEMVSPDGVRDRDSRQSLWEGVRAEPPQVPESPWAPVIVRAVAKDRERRPRTAHTLIRQLEDVTLRVEGAEDLRPYPGLASFTEDDAEYFFGREAEVETLWGRLDGPSRLLGLVGPSGAGKTSFLRAGVTPAAPSGWAVLRCTPGTSATASLRRALVPELGGDTGALADLASGEDSAAVAACARWRGRNSRALVIVDQFEELFTLNDERSQERFVELLRRLPLEADVHVVLSMRDDFLMESHRHEALRPVVSDLMLLDPPVGHSLRRALVQPATRCGYRFEDDALVDDMLAEVEGERGALPLLAFAAAQLWERRDREAGELTRDAYEAVGGVGGALARHAEATIDRIGAGRVPLVRELFRNLVTAEGTRAVREWDDLLSVFDGSGPASARQDTDRPLPHDDVGDRDAGAGFIPARVPAAVPTAPPPTVPARKAAAEVLRALVDARLLTTYDIHDDEHEPVRRVEIIHESLLANWPRLVRWQTQDADAAQLRDQLRQAARTWDEQDRSDDLLWTGAAYRQFAVWQESYPGGLSAVEQAFADAMARHAARAKRRRRIIVAAVLTATAAVAAVTTILWRRGMVETRRAQASTLLLKAQTELEDVGSNKLALPFAAASLELWDQPATRRMILRALWLAPPMRRAPWGHSAKVDFSPVGRWMAAIETFDPVRLNLMPPTGGEPIRWQAHSNPAAVTPWVCLWFVSDSVVATYALQDPELRLWSVPEGELLQTLPPVGFETSDNPEDLWRSMGTRVRLVRFEPNGTGGFTQDARGFDRVAQLGGIGGVAAALDATGDRLAYAHDGGLFVVDLSDPAGEPLRVAACDRPVQHLAWSAAGDRIATWQRVEGLRVVPLSGDTSPERRVWRPPQEHDLFWLTFDRTGTLLAGSAGSVVFVWDLLGPPDALPWTWRGRSGATFAVAFHPSATWLAASSAGGTALWPVARDHYPYVLRGHRGAVRELAFGPDGSWLVSASEDGTVRWWPLTPAAGSASRVLHDWGRIWDADLIPAHMPHFLAVAPDGAWVAVVGHGLEALAVVPVAGGEARRLHSGGDAPFAVVAVDPAGRQVAAALGMYGHRDAILVWDLETDEVRRIEAGGRVCDLRFLPDGSLLDITYAGTAFDLISSEEQASVGRRDLTTLERRRIDVTDGMHRLHLSADGRLLLGFGSVEEEQGDGRLAVVQRDLVEGTATELPQFGGLVFHGQQMALSPSGRLAAVQGEGVLTVGRTAGGEPHRVVVGRMASVAISPDDRWIAIGQVDGDVLLWPVPNLDLPPIDTLPRDELVARIEALTNARAVRDDQQPDGWGIEWAPFPGWEDVPEW